MKQIEKCPFVENKEKECDVPPCNTCYLNCIYKPSQIVGGGQMEKRGYQNEKGRN